MNKIAMAVVALVATSGAQATIISVSDTFGLASTNWTHSIGASQFNNTLGNLNSATVTFSGDMVQRFKAENIGADADTLTPVAQASFFFRKLLIAQQTLTLTGVTSSFAATAYDGTFDYAGTSGIDFGSVAANGAITFTVTGPALADFIGVGTLGSAGFDVVAKGEGRIDSDNGNLNASVTTQARYNLTVDYDYSLRSVPEPSALALVGLALVGVSVLRRKANQA